MKGIFRISSPTPALILKKELEELLGVENIVILINDDLESCIIANPTDYDFKLLNQISDVIITELIPIEVVKKIDEPITEHHYIEASDRYIFIRRNSFGDIDGINFMQGHDFEFFKKEFFHVDERLTEFYQLNRDMIKGENEIEVIDNTIWIFVDARNH